MMRILLISGGSGGHLYPLVAVTRALKKMHPHAELHIVCSDRPEDRAILKAEGIEARTLPLPRRGFQLPLTFVRNARGARKLLDEVRPDVVFSKGGAVSVALCRLAHRRGIPVVLHESDAVMGRANRMVARVADKICLGFPMHREADAAADPREIVTGNPVRPEITEGKRTEGLRITGLSGERPILLVTGGSQGAQALNQAVVASLDRLLRTVDVIHLTGKGKSGAKVRTGYFVREYAHAELPHLYALATLAMSRAGAGAIAELAANGIPAILVPIRGLANDHQHSNAVAASATGGFELLEQAKLEAKLARTVERIAMDTRILGRMREASRKMLHPEAAKEIAECILDIVNPRSPSRGSSAR